MLGWQKHGVHTHLNLACQIGGFRVHAHLPENLKPTLRLRTGAAFTSSGAKLVKMTGMQLEPSAERAGAELHYSTALFLGSGGTPLWGVVGRMVGSKSPRAVKPAPHLEPFSLKMVAPRVVFGTPGNPKWHNKSTF